jgi:hypothetical protein
MIWCLSLNIVLISLGKAASSFIPEPIFKFNQLFMKKSFLFVFVAFVFNNAWAQQRITEPYLFMETAFIEGLREQQFSPIQAKSLSNQPGLFIPKCVICSGVKKAFNTYSTEPVITGKPYKVNEALNDTSKQVQLKELEVLVDRYVQAYYLRHQYTPEEKANMETILTKEAQRSKMTTGAKYCASCTGSCKKPQ